MVTIDRSRPAWTKGADLKSITGALKRLGQVSTGGRPTAVFKVIGRGMGISRSLDDEVVIWAAQHTVEQKDRKSLAAREQAEQHLVWLFKKRISLFLSLCSRALLAFDYGPVEMDK